MQDFKLGGALKKNAPPPGSAPGKDKKLAGIKHYSRIKRKTLSLIAADDILV
jgi:hypothetical protein